MMTKQQMTVMYELFDDAHTLMYERIEDARQCGDEDTLDTLRGVIEQATEVAEVFPECADEFMQIVEEGRELLAELEVDYS